jgi:hypothetical protein
MTALGTAAAVVAWLSAATVATLGVAQAGASDPKYTTDVISQPGLRGGVIATFVLLTIPVLGLVAQSARLGAPARDRRIASIRLAGATPRQAIAIGAGESGVAAAIGSVLGLGAYFALRKLLDHPDRNGARAIPTDVVPPAAAIAVICVLLPIVVMLISAWLLQNATTSPLGVVQRVRRAAGPSAFVGLLLIAGVALFAGFAPLTRLLSHHNRYIPEWVALLIFYIGVMLAAIGVSVGAGWITYTTGRILRRLGSSPASRIAGGRMVADPWQGSRAFGVMIIAVMFAGGTAGVYQNFAVMEAVDAASGAAYARAAHDPGAAGVPETFYTNTTLLVGIAVGVAAVIGALGLLLSLTETIVSRRRTYAALVATGVPRSVLVRTQLWQTMAMAVPALLIAAGTGAGIARALFGGSQSQGGDQYSVDNGQHVHTLPTITRAIPIPWASLGLIVGGALAAVLVAVGIGLLFLRPSTSVEELRTA